MPLSVQPAERRAKILFSLTPVQSLVVGFAGFILVGALLLLLPFNQTDGSRTGFLDCLFTSTSATCVTGLVVVDTSSVWTRLGQVVILILIQCGGIGIITFGALFAILLGQRFTFRQRALLREQFGDTSLVNVFDFLSVIRVVAASTITIELTGAILLWPAFAAQYGVNEAAFHALFHAVSAFCNAGFSTFSTNLEAYKSHLVVNLVICGLIVLGGLGFPVFAELLDRLNRRKKLSLHTRVVLRTTGWLIFGGTALILLFETISGEAFKGMSLYQMTLASLFQSVTSRTAGYNTVPIGTLASATLLTIISLMFIGGSPAGTAGGIKTTTFATALAAMRAVLTGHGDVRLLDRRLDPLTVRRAIVLILLAGSLLVVCVAILMISGAGEPLALTFEAVSAFGTVGLSTGITPNLSSIQKLVIILLMFIGRVGPLAFALSLSRPRTELVRLPETDLLTG